MPTRYLRAVVLLLPLGCGVADYEAKMKETQGRLKQFEDEAKLLGPPVNPPVAKDAAGQDTALLAFFLRLPLGLAPQPTRGQGEELFHYYIPAQTQADTPYPWVALAFSKADDAAFVGKVMGRFTAREAATGSKVTTRHKATFSKSAFDDGKTRYVIALTKGKTDQVALVYAWPIATAGQAVRAIDMSLETFGVEDSLPSAQKAYQPRSPLERDVPR